MHIVIDIIILCKWLDYAHYDDNIMNTIIILCYIMHTMPITMIISCILLLDYAYYAYYYDYIMHIMPITMIRLCPLLW